MGLTMEEGVAFDNVPDGVYDVVISDTEENATIGNFTDRNRVTVEIRNTGEHYGKHLNRYFGKLSTGSLLNNDLLLKASIELKVGDPFELKSLEGYQCKITVVNKKGKLGGMFSNIVAWNDFLKGNIKQLAKQKHIAGKGKQPMSNEAVMCTQCGERIIPDTSYHTDVDGNVFHDQYGKRCYDDYKKAIEEAEKPKKKKGKK